MPTVLITGANRGVGAELVKNYLEKGYEVVAAVRDPATMKEQKGLVVIKLDAGTVDGAKEGIAELTSKHGIKSLDIVIANAAVNIAKESFKDLNVEDMQKTWEVNVRGPLLLFQATYDLLPKPNGKFVVISSGSGTIGQEHKLGQSAYGQSKAAVNYMVSKLHYEHPELIILAISPGWLDTDMGRQGGIWGGSKGTPLKVSDTNLGIIKVIDECTKDNYSGRQVGWRGNVMDW